MEHGKEARLAIRKLIEPGIGAERAAAAAAKVEDRHGSIPRGLAVLFFVDSHSVNEGGRAAMLGLDGLSKLIVRGLGHCAYYHARAHCENLPVWML